MLTRALTISATLALATGTAAQDEFTVLPVPEGETARTVIERVIATERTEVAGGPAYILVRERTGMTPMPALSVYKRIDGLGYFHVPPAFLQFEIPAALGEGGAAPDFSLTDITGPAELKYGILGGMTLGGAALAELFVPGTGGWVADEGRAIIQDMTDRDRQALEAGLAADDDMRARVAALREFVRRSTLLGLADVDGEETWYLSADDLDIRQPSGPDDFAFQGEMVITRAELWVSRRLDRIVGLRFTGHGAEGSHYLIPIEPFEWGQQVGGFDTEITDAKVPVGDFVIRQVRSDFREVESSRFHLPRSKLNYVNFEPGSPSEEETGAIRALLARYAAMWNENVERHNDGEMSDQEWESFRSAYEEFMVGVETAYRMSTLPIEGESEIRVECAVPAPDAETLVALMADLGEGALVTEGCEQDRDGGGPEA